MARRTSTHHVRQHRMSGATALPAVVVVPAAGGGRSSHVFLHAAGHPDSPGHTEVSCVVKYFLFGFNVLFWLIGGGCVAVGLWAWSEKQVFDNLARIADLTFLDPALILIVIGGLMFSIGFCGCVGALRENRRLLLVYAVTISILLFLYIATAVLLFALKDWVSLTSFVLFINCVGLLCTFVSIMHNGQFKDQVRNELMKAIQLYREDDDLQSLVDWVQKDWLHCCGIDGNHDWEKNLYFNCSSPGEEACGVPYSCCKDSILLQYSLSSQSGNVSSSSGRNANSRSNSAGSNSEATTLINYQCGNGMLKKPDAVSYIHSLGCIAAGEQWIQSNLVPVAAVGVSIGVVQIFGICLAQTLRSDIKAQSSRFL